METSYAVDLTAGEILIIRESLKKLKEDVMPVWQYKLAEKALSAMEEAYEKPRITAAEMKAKVEKERKFWEKEGGGSFVVAQMALGKEIKLRFWNDIEGEEI